MTRAAHRPTAERHRVRGNALVSRPSARLGARSRSVAGWVERLCETKRIVRRRRASLPLEPSCESTCSDALSRAALAPQLTDRAVCEPPQIPLAILGQSREAPG